MATHTYRNRSTGQVVGFDEPQPRLERLARWETIGSATRPPAKSAPPASEEKPGPDGQAEGEQEEHEEPEQDASPAPEADRPPKTGAGSGKAAWAAYAAAVGIDPEGLSKPQIIEAVEAKEK